MGSEPFSPPSFSLGIYYLLFVVCLSFSIVQRPVFFLRHFFTESPDRHPASFFFFPLRPFLFSGMRDIQKDPSSAVFTRIAHSPFLSRRYGPPDIPAFYSRFERSKVPVLWSPLPPFFPEIFSKGIRRRYRIRNTFPPFFCPTPAPERPPVEKFFQSACPSRRRPRPRSFFYYSLQRRMALKGFAPFCDTP